MLFLLSYVNVPISTNKDIIFILKNVRGGGGELRLFHEHPKIWYAHCRRYLIFYLSYDYVTCYTYRLCCPD